jgi:DNA-binding GntR family transcriptional regulator
MTGERSRTTLYAISRVDALVAALRDQILDGTIRQGTSLREAELCDTFDVSRHTVRTALRALEHECLVRHEPNRKVYVPMLTAADVIDIYKLRSAIELEAVRYVADQPDVLEALQGAVKRLRELDPQAPWGEARERLMDFHEALVDGLHSPRASHAFDVLRKESRLCFLQIREEFEDHPRLVRHHQAVLDELDAGNIAATLTLLRDHLDEARDHICAGLSSLDQESAIHGARS